MKRILMFVVLTTASVVGRVHADMITFGGLTGSNGDPFTTYTEGSFTVTPSDSNWLKAFSFGNPVPDIFSSATTSFIDVTLTAGGTFTFAGVDLGNANSIGSPSYTIQGFLGGSVVLTTNGTWRPARSSRQSRARIPPRPSTTCGSP